MTAKRKPRKRLINTLARLAAMNSKPASMVIDAWTFRVREPLEPMLTAEETNMVHDLTMRLKGD